MNTPKHLSARPRYFPFLTLLIAAIALLTCAPRSARAGNEIPFNANFITQVETALDLSFLHVTVNGQGQATGMGKATAFTDDQLVNLADGSGKATYTLTGAKGDALVLALIVQPGGTIDAEGGILFSGSYTVSGGTGRFNGTTGSGVFAGEALGAFFVTDAEGIGAFTLVGTVTLPGE